MASILNYEFQGFVTTELKKLGAGTTANQFALMHNNITGGTITKTVDGEEPIVGLIDGVCSPQTLATTKGTASYEVTFDSQEIGKMVLSQMFNELWTPTASYTGREVKRFAVPTTAPYEVTIPGITASTPLTDVQITITEPGPWGTERQLEAIGTGTPTAQQFKLDAGKVTFIAGLAGAPFKVSLPKVYTNITSLGVEANFQEIGKLRFTGLLCSTGASKIAVEMDLSPSGGWELPIGDQPELTITYQAVASGANRSPVRFYDLTNAVAA